MTAEQIRQRQVFLTCGPGFVYLTRWSDGECKIGMSINPMARAVCLGMDLIHTIPVNNMRRAEMVAHNEFSDKQKYRGEYFWLNDKDIRKFKRLNNAWFEAAFKKHWIPSYVRTGYLVRSRLAKVALVAELERSGSREDWKGAIARARAGSGNSGGWFLLSVTELRELNLAYRKARRAFP